MVHVRKCQPEVIYYQKLTCMAILWNHAMRTKDHRLPGRNALGASRFS
jgi:hypothetical protein